MEPLIEGERFARKCSVTGEGFNEGYCIEDGIMYIKYRVDLIKHLRILDWEDADGNRSQNIKHDGDLLEFFYAQEYYYHTAWEDDEDYEYIVVGGELVEIDGENDQLIRRMEKASYAPAEEKMRLVPQKDLIDIVIHDVEGDTILIVQDADRIALSKSKVDAFCATLRPVQENADVWDFVEKYHPNYHGCNEIAWTGDLQKIMDNDFEEDSVAAETLRVDYKNNKNHPSIKIDFDIMMKKIYEESIENFIKIKGGL